MNKTYGLMSSDAHLRAKVAADNGAAQSAEPRLDDADNPEWTEADFARAKPAAEVLSAEVLAGFPRPRGRPAGSDKERITIRIDKATLERFRATGPGWQSRINEVLGKFAG